jgi:hypothetical protein
MRRSYIPPRVPLSIWPSHSDDSASVEMFDRQTGAIVFAHAVNKKNTMHGHQTTAEACAKHLKEQIEKKP